ncbi:MAG TPA: hypothetical protein VIH83_02235, partial [Candidatus Bathyarchaeia archaeon]
TGRRLWFSKTVFGSLIAEEALTCPRFDFGRPSGRKPKWVKSAEMCSSLLLDRDRRRLTLDYLWSPRYPPTLV